MLCRCQCGTTAEVRAQEILDGKSTKCRSCASRIKSAATPAEQRIATARHASAVAASVAHERRTPARKHYGDAYLVVRNIGVSAKQRCTNPNTVGYANYGGRGIRFEFTSVAEFAVWVLDHLGPLPSPNHSIDRIDNARGYEPGNLRWATREEQGRNKRVYRRTKNGERILKLQTQRPDVTYETLRTWVRRGLTDIEIIKRRKYESSSV